MPVKKFRTFEEAERDLWSLRPDERYYQKLRAFYALALKLRIPLFPRGISKFRTIEEAGKQVNS